MSSNTRTGTRTTTITGGDVREVMRATWEESAAICNAAACLAPEFDADQAQLDCSLLALNDVISAIHLQIYLGDELVREYAFEIADGPLEAGGPPPDQPPLGHVPDGARVRLIVSPNPRISPEVSEGWFRRLGWSSAEPLRRPENARAQVYGTHVSGGYGVVRSMLSNPKFDRPVTRPAHLLMRKER